MMWNKMSMKKTLLNLALMLFISKTFREVSLTTSNFRVGRGPKWPNNGTLQKDYIVAEKMKILMVKAKKLQDLLPQNMMESLNNAVRRTVYCYHWWVLPENNTHSLHLKVKVAVLCAH